MYRALSFIVLLSWSCSSTPIPGKTCVGGIILDGGADAGECVAKCDPTKCLANNTCVNNACALKCDSQFDCDPMALTQQCVAATDDDTGAAIFVCVASDTKGIGVACPIGFECTQGTVCHTSGLGDATAYCTNSCKADADCPGGFECGTVRAPINICGADGGVVQGGAFCGSADDAGCTAMADVAADPTLEIGAFCVEQKQCLKRTSCSACTGDPDCSLSNEKCVQIGIDMRCAAACNVDKDCEAGKKCNQGFCRNYVTDCVVAPPAFCTPCRYDHDCAPSFACQALHGTEKSCLDPSFSLTCTTSTNCPVAPSGLHGECFNENDEFTSTDPLYHHCYAPEPTMDQFSCYK